ncbi:DUF7673 family protein [Citrifermentans bremense]
MGFRVERHEYAVAIAAMVELAQMNCGGSRVAAQVLLSAYNGDDYQLDVTDIHVLSRDNHDYAMAVISLFHTTAHPAEPSRCCGPAH